MANEAQNESLRKRMAALGIREADLREQFVLGSGSGGQKVNKTHSCVLLTHLPTGEVVRCQWTRSRARNRELAREELCSRFEKRQERKAARSKAATARRRRINRRPSRASRRKREADKRHRSRLKQLRRRPADDR